MAKKIVYKTPFFVRSAPPAVAFRDTLLEGVLCGLVGGEAVPADFRAAQGPIEARGFILQSALRKDLRGNIVGYDDRVGYAREAVIQDDDANYTPHMTYFLHTGGGMIAIPADAAAGDLRQAVGYAESSKIIVGCVGDAIRHA